MFENDLMMSVTLDREESTVTKVTEYNPPDQTEEGSTPDSMNEQSCYGCTDGIGSIVMDCAKEMSDKAAKGYQVVQEKLRRHREEAIARGQYRLLPVADDDMDGSLRLATSCGHTDE